MKWLTLLFLCACNLPESSVPNVKLWATLPDGCKIYKISQGRERVYTTTCPGVAEWSEINGRLQVKRRVETDHEK